MIRLELSQTADADLVSILEYGILAFGVETAEAYLASFEEAFDLIRRHPMSGGEIDTVRRTCRTAAIGYAMTCSRIMGLSSACCTWRWTWRSGWGEAQALEDSLALF